MLKSKTQILHVSIRVDTNVPLGNLKTQNTLRSYSIPDLHIMFTVLLIRVENQLV